MNLGSMAMEKLS